MVQYTKRNRVVKYVQQIKLVMSFIIFLFVMKQLYPNQECRNEI